MKEEQTPLNTAVSAPPPAGELTRLVDKLFIHDVFTSFRGLCEKVLSPQTRYLVLDLDRTFHFGRNMGERFGWYIIGYQCYGEDFFAEVRRRGGKGRALFIWRQPLTLVRYLLRGARLWAYPGLLYLFFVKIGSKYRWSKRRLYRLFGIHAVDRVQGVPRVALMHQLADLPKETLDRLAELLWEQQRDWEVILPEDIAWLREKYPGLKIIISSASPQPILDAAARRYAVDKIIYTSVEEEGGYFSAPHLLDARFLRFRRPRRISPPDKFFQNAAEAKIARLRAFFPDICSPTVETVGITDNSYNEDAAWAEHFTKVVDLNSPVPFSPLVPTAAPLLEIHSAVVPTRAEHEELARGVIDAEALLRRRWRRTAPAGSYLRQELERAAAPLKEQMEKLAELFRRQVEAAAERSRHWAVKAAEHAAELALAVERYNNSLGRERRRAWRWLKKQLRRGRALEREKLFHERPLALLKQEMEDLAAEARRRLEEKRKN